MEISDGSIVVAAITSCTNTSNPSVMLGAGLVAKKAAALGLKRAPWVKTSLGPGSMAVTRYLERAGLIEPLKALGFHNVGYGCTVCIGNTGPLPAPVSKAIADHDLCAVSILSGNRNFEGRVHAEVRMNYLASPPLVVAYAIAGRIDIDPYTGPLAKDASGKPVYLKDIWPTQAEIDGRSRRTSRSTSSPPPTPTSSPATPAGSPWPRRSSQTYDWPDSTYIRNPPYFEGMTMEVGEAQDIHGARCLAVLGDSITTDHISPAGLHQARLPGRQVPDRQGCGQEGLQQPGQPPRQPRGHDARHLRQHPAAQPDGPGDRGRGAPCTSRRGEPMSIFDAAMQYQAEGIPAIVLAGKEYGSGSSRDWAAKGPRLLGVQAVIAESYERIHRSNLVGMGILPLEFVDGANAQSLGLTGTETFDIRGSQQRRGQAGRGPGHRRRTGP